MYAICIHVYDARRNPTLRHFSLVSSVWRLFKPVGLLNQYSGIIWRGIWGWRTKFYRRTRAVVYHHASCLLTYTLPHIAMHKHRRYMSARSLSSIYPRYSALTLDSAKPFSKSPERKVGMDAACIHLHREKDQCLLPLPSRKVGPRLVPAGRKLRCNPNLLPFPTSQRIDNWGTDGHSFLVYILIRSLTRLWSRGCIVGSQVSG